MRDRNVADWHVCGNLGYVCQRGRKLAVIPGRRRAGRRIPPRLESFQGAVAPVGESRPAWKVLRVLANRLAIDGCEYFSSEQVRDEIKQQCRDVQLDNMGELDAVPVEAQKSDATARAGDVPIFSVDPLTRRAAALQNTADAKPAGVTLSPRSAETIGLSDGGEIVVTQNGVTQTLSLAIDEGVADGCAWIPQGLEATAALGGGGGEIKLGAGKSTDG